MGYATEHDVLLIAGKQAGFGVVAAAGRVVPIAKGGQGPTHDRNKIANDGRYQDGHRRPFALGNHKSGVDEPLVPNLDYVGYPLYGFLGQFTDAVAGPLNSHAGILGKNIIYYTHEESYGNGDFYQYFDNVYSEYSFEFSNEGIYKPTFKSAGSGKLVKAVASFDAAADEVAGRPVEMINWATLIDAEVEDAGVVSKLSCTAKREIIEVRPSGANGLCKALKVGELTVDGTITILFTNDTYWEKARNGTKMKVKATVTRGEAAGTYSIEHLFSEMFLVPSAPKKQSGQVVSQDFTFESDVESDANSPLKITLINGTVTHNA